MENLGLTHGLSTDIIGPSTSMMGASLGLGNPYMQAYMNNGAVNPYCNTNYLGGITMTGQPARDTFSGVLREKHRNIHGIKKVLAYTGIALLGFFTAGKFRQLGKAIKSVFK